MNPADAWSRLGDAYRVEVRIVIWEAEGVPKVPTSALVRIGEAWAVYVVEDGRARSAIIGIGRRSGLEAEVTSGLAEGVVVHPGDALRDGSRVQPRSGGPASIAGGSSR